MAIKFSSVNEAVEDNGLKILVHGPAGAGKTVLSSTAEAPTLIINAEAGLLSLARAPKHVKELIKVATISTLTDLYDVYNLLVANPGDFEWIALDSISEIAEKVLSYEKAQTKDPRKAYGELQDQLNKLLRAFRDLPDYNVLMTCKQELTKDSYTGINSYGPSLPGNKLPQAVPYLFDEVFALRVERNEEGQIFRVLQTSRDMQYEAKDRSGALAMYEQPNLKIIHDKIRNAISSGVYQNTLTEEPHNEGEGETEEEGNQE